MTEHTTHHPGPCSTEQRSRTRPRSRSRPLHLMVGRGPPYVRHVGWASAHHWLSSRAEGAIDTVESTRHGVAEGEAGGIPRSRRVSDSPTPHTQQSPPSSQPHPPKPQQFPHPSPPRLLMTQEIIGFPDSLIPNRLGGRELKTQNCVLRAGGGIPNSEFRLPNSSSGLHRNPPCGKMRFLGLRR